MPAVKWFYKVAMRHAQHELGWEKAELIAHKGKFDSGIALIGLQNYNGPWINFAISVSKGRIKEDEISEETFWEIVGEDYVSMRTV